MLVYLYHAGTADARVNVQSKGGRLPFQLCQGQESFQQMMLA